MFKMTKKELELIKNICKHLLIEKGMREAISYIAKKYIKPNKKYMTDYDSSKKSTFIVYLDSKNLNGWAMVQYLPDGGFKWLTQKEIDKYDVISIS